jgi:hypothetical protein
MRGMERKIVFVPSLVMVNREKCSMRFCSDYIARILTWSRLYEPTFGWTVAHACVNLIPLIGAFTCLAVAILTAQWVATLLVLSAIMAHTAFLGLAYLLVRRGVARVAKGRDERFERLSGGRLLKIFGLIPVALAVYALGLIRAVTKRYVCWRGVWYYIADRTHIVVLAYQPFDGQSGEARPETSL